MTGAGDGRNALIIAPADFDRWRALAWSAEPLTPNVLNEIVRLEKDPCGERLRRVAIAAWFASTLADDPLRSALMEMARETERAAE